ncbi:MAG: DUF3095 domain-containing protein [Ignavibacteriales bacterium]|nr:DUF3095 domain-containing protein [Ignavibacteriales bacterium]
MPINSRTNSESFYLNLPVTENFLDISNPAIYTKLPDDWHVVATDLKDSTTAIQKGMYKEVNLMGASSIMAMLNLTKSFSLPFVFGGDGATICIPNAFVEKARKALTATRQMARKVYGFDFRVGIVPITDIRRAGFDVLVARYRVSENFVQAVFTGWGLQYAEESIKDPKLSGDYNLDSNDDDAGADYSGLECRWKNVPSEHGEIVSLIVQATVANPEERNKIYREVIAKVSEVYGSDTMCHPVNKSLLRSAFNERKLSGESNIRTFGKGSVARVLYWFYIRFKVVLGAVLMKTGYKSRNIDWGTYKSQLVANTDYRKFDDKLRQTLSGTPEQRAKLETYLEGRFRKNELVYGTHFAPTALITCLIFSYSGAHIHLVDSDNGGYATAAAQLKERLRARKSD